jgi:hypothetical protein
MSRLSDLSASVMLREYAQGAAQESIQPVAEFLAPTVPVPTQVGRYKQYNEKNRFHIPKTLRGVGGRATELSFSVNDQTYNCAPHALDFPVDNLEQLEEASLESVLQEGATMIAEVAGLAHEKAVIDAALTVLSSPVTTAWVTATTDDPVNLIDSAILSVIKAAKYGSLMGVGVLFGAGAFKAFKNAYTVRSRFVVSGSPAFPNVTPDVASSLFIGTPDTRVSYMVYDDAAEGVAASMKFVLDNSCIVFARKPQPTRRDPSFMKTFRLTGHFMVPGSYMREDGRAEVAKYDWSEDIKVTNSVSAVLLSPSDVSETT